MPAARRDPGERRAGRHPEQPALRVELVEQPEEVVLVGAAAVVEDQRPLGLAGRLAQPVDQVARLAAAHAGVAVRGLATGHQLASISSRRSSRNGGRISFSPRCSGSSSTPKPGTEGRDLEQHSARLAEVDRAKPEAVDHGCRMSAAADRPLAPGQMLVHLGGPGDVVDGAGSLQAGLGRRLVVVPAPPRASPAPRSRPRRARTRAPPAARRCARDRRCRRERSRSPAGPARAAPPDGRRSGARPAPRRRPARARAPRGRRSAGGPPRAAFRARRRRVARPRSQAPRRKPTRQPIRWTIPAPARPRGAPRNSKKVRSEPGLPSSSA